MIYDDGLIIYQTPKQIDVGGHHGDYSWAKEFCYRAGHVPNPEAFIRKLFPYKWSALKSKYVLSAATDQKTTWLWHCGQIVEIYGDWRRFLKPDEYGSFEHSAEIVAEENRLRRSLPVALRRFLEDLNHYSDPKAGMWLPDAIQVSLFEYKRNDAKPILWPAGFPIPDKINQDSATRVSDIALPGANYLEFRDLLSRTTYPSAVSIDGNCFVISNFTFAVPGEEVWKRDMANKTAQEEAEYLNSIRTLSPEIQADLRKMLGR